LLEDFLPLPLGESEQAVLVADGDLRLRRNFRQRIDEVLAVSLVESGVGEAGVVDEGRQRVQHQVVFILSGGRRRKGTRAKGKEKRQTERKTEKEMRKEKTNEEPSSSPSLSLSL
jgi:hypothetical protein